MRNALRKNVIFLHQVQIRHTTALKVVLRQKQMDKIGDRWEGTANRKARNNNQSVGDRTRQK